MNTGVIAMGVRCPIIREGDFIEDIVIDNVKKTLSENNMSFDNCDVIGITESVVARSQGNYVTVDDIVQFMTERNFKKKLILYFPIMSRNRFSMILKAFARYAENINIYVHIDTDEVGNPVYGENPYTGVNIQDYYKELAQSEGCELTFTCFDLLSNYPSFDDSMWTGINCMCHPENIDFNANVMTLQHIMNRPVKRADGSLSGYNEDWGLLGSNKADEETLKLFPQKKLAQKVVDEIQDRIFNETGKHVEVLIYGDGCFASPHIPGVRGSHIWEFADPVTTPAYTNGLEGSPTEIKLKAFADGKYKHLRGKELEDAIKKEIEGKCIQNLKGKMTSQGTTPRRYVDLLASMFDLVTGSGDRGCPVVVCKNYFRNYSMD